MSRHRSGLTLVELLVALVVAGVVAAAAQRAVALVSDVRARSRSEREAALGTAAARATLRDWLWHAAAGEALGGFEGRRRRSRGTPRDEVAFAVTDGGSLHPGPRRIRLWIDDDPLTPRSGLLAEIAPVPGALTEPAETLEVAPRATGLELRYLAVEGRRREWLEVWHSDERVPVAVEFRLHFPPGPRGAAGPRLLALPLRVPVALGVLP